MKNHKSDSNTKSSSGESKSISVSITDSMKKKFMIKEVIYFIYHLLRFSLALSLIIFTAKTNLDSIFELSVYDRLQENLNLWEKGSNNLIQILLLMSKLSHRIIALKALKCILLHNGLELMKDVSVLLN